MSATTPSDSVPASGAGAPIAEAHVSPALAPPPGNPRFPLFDGLRGFAVLAVLATHTFTLTGRVGLGVDGRAAEVLGGLGPIVFFVISGFLLYRPYVSARAAGRDGPPVWRFARRRALRILPAYWLALTALAIFPGLPGVFSGDWWRYYGFLQVYSVRTADLGIAVAWTLCVEVSFYILLPLWAAAVRRARPRPSGSGLLRDELPPIAVVALAGVLVDLGAARLKVSQPLARSIAGQCTWLLLGMTLAVLSVASQLGQLRARSMRAVAGRPEACWVAAVAAFALLVALVPANGLFGVIAAERTPQSLLTTLARIILTAAFCIALVIPAVFDDGGSGAPRRVLAAPPLRLLGVISYSFYLLHLTIAELLIAPRVQGTSTEGLGLVQRVHVAPNLILFLVVLLATAGLAAVGYRLVELPFLRLKEGARADRRLSYPPSPQ